MKINTYSMKKRKKKLISDMKKLRNDMKKEGKKMVNNEGNRINNEGNRIDRIGIIKYTSREIIVKNGGRIICPVGSIDETKLMFING